MLGRGKAETTEKKKQQQKEASRCRLMTSTTTNVSRSRALSFILHADSIQQDISSRAVSNEARASSIGAAVPGLVIAIFVAVEEHAVSFILWQADSIDGADEVGGATPTLPTAPVVAALPVQAVGDTGHTAKPFATLTVHRTLAARTAARILATLLPLALLLAHGNAMTIAITRLVKTARPAEPATAVGPTLLADAICHASRLTSAVVAEFAKATAAAGTIAPVWPTLLPPTLRLTVSLADSSHARVVHLARAASAPAPIITTLLTRTVGGAVGDTDSILTYVVAETLAARPPTTITATLLPCTIDLTATTAGTTAKERHLSHAGGIPAKGATVEVEHANAQHHQGIVTHRQRTNRAAICGPGIGCQKERTDEGEAYQMQCHKPAHFMFFLNDGRLFTPHDCSQSPIPQQAPAHRGSLPI